MCTEYIVCNGCIGQDFSNAIFVLWLLFTSLKLSANADIARLREHLCIKHYEQRLSTMSTSTAGKKRKVDVQEDDANSAGQSISGGRGEGEKLSQAS